jgi:hypothetical protein
MTSVTVGHGATITGRLLARTAAVSLGGDRITVPACVLNAGNSAPRSAAVVAGDVDAGDLAPALAAEAAIRLVA